MDPSPARSPQLPGASGTGLAPTAHPGSPSAPQPCFPAPRPRAAHHAAVSLDCWRPPWTTAPRVTGRGLARPVPAPRLGPLPALLVPSPRGARDAVQRTGRDVPPWLGLVGGGGRLQPPQDPSPDPDYVVSRVGPWVRDTPQPARRCPAVAGSNPEPHCTFADLPGVASSWGSC